MNYDHPDSIYTADTPFPSLEVDQAELEAEKEMDNYEDSQNE